MAVSGLLACTNIIVGLWAHSTSVVATGFEFAGDVLASGSVLIGIGVAARPADRNHPYASTKCSRAKQACRITSICTSKSIQC